VDVSPPACLTLFGVTPLFGEAATGTSKHICGAVAAQYMLLLEQPGCCDFLFAYYIQHCYQILNLQYWQQ